MLQLFDFSEPTTWIVISIACCVIPVVIMTALTLLAISSGRRLLGQINEPNTDDLMERYEKLRARNPRATPEQLVRKVVNRQAFLAGLVGAITSFGGILTLPIALPLDMYASMRIQNTMVYFIARVYGYQNMPSVEKRAIDYMVMSGGTSLARQGQRVSTYLAARIALRVSEKALAKIVPIIGAAVGFGVNYFLTQTTGRSAIHYYSGNLNRRLGFGHRPPELHDGR